MDKKDFAQRAAHYFAEINAAHPFLEGNGRTNRVFISQLANEAGYEIDWRSMSKEKYIEASINSFNGDNELLENLIETNSSFLKKAQSNHAIQYRLSKDNDDLER